ncbi:hypothetical protein [Halomonas sp. I5-271120]|uniref:hypothetical protein n=1 Tax=Halomonas sp. I5-271120 TaxID=3061632 RepID=UPI0027147DAE|nr:hypothetical protein [Halomonas sp. I5-271120]
MGVAASTDVMEGRQYRDFPDHAWLQAELEHGDEIDQLMLEEAAKLACERNDAWHAILQACDGDLIGVELQQKRLAQYALILPDASEPGRYRAQLFDAKGFFGHFTRDEPMEVLEALVGEGYVSLATGRLSELSQTSEWMRGTRITNLIAELNQGRITHSELLASMAAAGA